METFEFPAIRCTLRAHRFHGLPECVETMLADAFLVPMEKDTFYLYEKEKIKHCVKGESMVTRESYGKEVSTK